MSDDLPPRSPARAKRILVVDDDVDGAEMLALYVRRWGHDVRVAHGADTAVAAAMEFLPDVALIDIVLDGEETGYEVAAKLRDLDRMESCRLVAVTALAFEKDREESRRAGFHAHVTKPFEPGELSAAIADNG